MRTLVFAIIALLMTVPAFAASNCTASQKRAVCDEKIVKEKVDWACQLVEKKGDSGLSEISGMRFDCCGEPNYVWINDMHPKMIMHPIKKNLNAQDLTGFKDPDGTPLFVNFVESVKKAPAGGWVPYKWTKLGETEPTNKRSWVKGCKVKGNGEMWVVGSGTWSE